MAKQHFLQKYPNLISIYLLLILPFSALSASGDKISEKQTVVVMRMIGHEVLKSLGDFDSRVMPIQKIGERYKIPFEAEFGIDPFDIITIVDSLISETGIKDNYLVEVEQCVTGEVVHSFMIGPGVDPDLVACKGRDLPRDCYSLLVSILDDSLMIPYNLSGESESPSDTIIFDEELSGSNTLNSGSVDGKDSKLFSAALIVFPILSLLGLLAYVVRKKNPGTSDPNLIRIGSFLFDKRTMLLTHKNQEIELSHKEAELLAVLQESVNEPIEREVILQKVWGDEGDYVGRTLDVFVSKLRKKLDADDNVKIVNIRGIGYKLITDLPD